MRSLAPPSPEAVCDAAGGEVWESRLAKGDHPFGPFQTHADYHDFTTWTYTVPFLAQQRPELAQLSQRSYRSVFTHGDLAPRNVLVRGDKLAAIIDWETSGWWPEYC